jgi:DNA repair exonuclease SbcCD ATPase subunit
LREALPLDVPDETINAYHESKGSYELFPKEHQDTVIRIMLETDQDIQEVERQINEILERIKTWQKEISSLKETLELLLDELLEPCDTCPNRNRRILECRKAGCPIAKLYVECGTVL